MTKPVHDASDARLAALKTIISSIPEGAALLDMAARQELHIYFDDTIEEHVSGYYTKSWNTLRLNPIKDNDDLIATLAHELRHMWQDRVITISDEERAQLDPLAHIVLIRAEEGDAYAFERYFNMALKEENRQRKFYEKADWMHFFLGIQAFHDSYDRRAIEWAKAQPTINMEEMMDRFPIHQIFMQGLSDSSYWDRRRNLVRTLLSYVDKDLLKDLRKKSFRKNKGQQ